MNSQGIIEPLSHSIVPLTVVARHTEEIQDIVNIYLPGSNQPLEVLFLCQCFGCLNFKRCINIS